MRHVLLLLLLLAACSSPLEVKVVGDTQFFELNKVKLIERNQDADTFARFGVVSDLHGQLEYTQKIADVFAQQQVEYVFILGDSVHNGQLRAGDTKDDTQELIEVLQTFAKLDIPVFVMPGNHERKSIYQKALTQVAAHNILDMMQYRILDLDDVAIIAIPGYHDLDFLPQDGYQYTQKDLDFIPTVASALNSQPILLTHGPPQTKGEKGIDYVPSVGNVGDPQLNILLQSINYSISGHIHEAGPNMVDSTSASIDLNTLLPQAWINAGPGEEGFALIIDMKAGKLMAKSIEVK